MRNNCNMYRTKNKFKLIFPELCSSENDYKHEALQILQKKGKTEEYADEIFKLATMSRNTRVKDKWEVVIKFKDYL